MSFFRYQRQKLGILLAWGGGSAAAGSLILLIPWPFWRQFGLQAFAWGAIDLLLAAFGRRDALLKAVRYDEGELDDDAALRAAERFQRILLVNAGLDVLYVLGGLLTARRFADRPDRRGLGWGIAVQGAFLLLYDALLARDVGRRWLSE